MVTFSGPEVVVENLTAKQLYHKLSNLTNLKEIIPSNIENFEATEDSCSFKMKGMPKLEMSLTEKTPFSKISLSANESPVNFSLNCFITNYSEKCQARLEVKADLNIMMKMMVEKPLTQFLDVLASKMQNF